MAVFALDLVLWLTGVRSHISHYDDFRPDPVPPAAGTGNLFRVVAMAVAACAVLSAAVWWTVRLAIELH